LSFESLGRKESVITLTKVIETIISLAIPVIKDKLQRNEHVIKVLKKFNLDPDHPPVDFTGIYAYTLVEFGIGKPKLVLDMFREDEIQKLFRKAFDEDNPISWFKGGEDFLFENAIGADLRETYINQKQELSEFAAAFMKVAKRSRKPAEVIASHRIESLHRKVDNIQEEVQTGIARIEGQNQLLLSAGTVEKQSQEERCKAFTLAQQMKGWFETLSYQFESYTVWGNDYFEWIINIPVRRGRYDRILVRGIDGEAGLCDLNALRQSVEVNKTDEGWLISARRISRAVRDAIEQEENKDLVCHTFDELLDQDADFTGYLDWLESEIKRRGIEQKYVPLACTKEEIDPDTKQSIGRSRYGETDGYIDLWLDDPAKEHISILGEFGTGKTWFVFHYASQALNRYREAQKRGVERPRLPLVIPLRDYAKAVSVESLFSEFFFRKHEVRSLTYSGFEQLNRMGKLLLIFDGFDEMAARVDRQQMINNFWELAKVVMPKSKVILTCRTEHFPEAKEGRMLLSAELQASTSNLTGEIPQFEELELEKFDNQQIRQVLSLQTDPETVEKVMGNPQLLDLASRPVMTELILEALPDIEAGKPIDMSRVYLYAVRRKMERDIKEERTFTSLADKLYFLCELSWEMLSSNRMSLNYREFPARIRHLFGDVVQEEKDLDHWHYDMMGQTMLIRNADGDYMPAHRSLLEFFVAYKFAAELGALATDFTELAQSQSYLSTNKEPQDYTWSSCFNREIGREQKIKPKSKLLKFIPETLSRLVETIGKQRIAKAVIDLLKNMLVQDQEKLIEHLLSILLLTQDKSTEEVRFIGANLLNLMLKINPEAIKNKDLSKINLNSFDFRMSQYIDFYKYKINLYAVVFRSANLENSIFGSQDLSNIDFQYSNFNGVKFKFKQFDDLSLHPDGSQIVISSPDDIILWDLQSNSLDKRIKIDSSWHIKHSPDGKFLINTIWSGFEIRDSQSLDIVSIHKNTKVIVENVDGDRDNLWTSSFTFTADSKTLFIGCNNAVIYVWDFIERQQINILLRHTSCIESIVISNSNKFLASSSYKELIVWDTQTLTPIKEKKWKNTHFGNILFHPNEQLITIDDNKKGILILNPRDLEIIDYYPIQGAEEICLNSDGTLLCIAGKNWLKILNLDTKKYFELQLKKQEFEGDEFNMYSPTKICFDKQKQLFIIAYKDGNVVITDVMSGMVTSVISHLPKVLNTDFRNVTGLNQDLAQQLKQHGAIIDY